MRKSAMLAGHCAAVGRDPGGDHPRVGRPRRLARERRGACSAAGVGVLTTGIGGKDGRYDLGPLRELLAWRDGLRAG